MSKFLSSVTAKRATALLLALSLIFVLLPDASVMASETFVVHQGGPSIDVGWLGLLGSEDADKGTPGQYGHVYASYIRVMNGPDAYSGKIAYCIQNKKDGPNNDVYTGIPNPGQTYYGPMWSRGVRAILANGFRKSGDRPFGVSSDDEAYFATTQAIRFWVAECARLDGKATSYNYDYHDLSTISSETLAGFKGGDRIVRNGTPIITSSTASGNRCLSAAIDLLLLARQTVNYADDDITPEYSISPVESASGDIVMSAWTDENGNGTMDEGDYYDTLWDIDLGNTTSAIVDLTKLPLGTKITDVNNNNVGENQVDGTGFVFKSSQRIKVRIPWKTSYEEAVTEGMRFDFIVFFGADNKVAPGNVVLAEPVNYSDDYHIQRVVFMTDQDFIVGEKDYKIETPSAEIKKGYLKIVKTDDSDNPLKGVEFDLYAIDESTKEETCITPNHLPTDENGEILIDLIPGTYKVVEVAVPEGFDVNSKYTGEAPVYSEKVSLVNVMNTKLDQVYGTVILDKTMRDILDTSAVPEAGVKFSITKVDAKFSSTETTVRDFTVTRRYENLSLTGTTNSEGRVMFQNLSLGTYLVEQLTTTDGYDYIEPFIINIRNANPIVENFVDIKISDHTMMRIAKVDETVKNGNYGISDAQNFTEDFYNRGPNVGQANITAFTDYLAKAKISNVASFKIYDKTTGKYLYNYENGNSTRNFKTGFVYDMSTAKPIAAASGELTTYSSSTNTVTKKNQTAKTGEVILINIPTGHEYEITETVAPYGYSLNRNTYKRNTIKNSAGILYAPGWVVVGDSAATPYLTVHKTGDIYSGFKKGTGVVSFDANGNRSANETKVPNVISGDIAGATISLYANQTYSNTNKGYIKSGDFVFSLVSTGGYDDVTGLLRGKWYFQETAAPKGYKLNSQKYYATIPTNAYTADVVEITNELIPASITVSKAIRQIDGSINRNVENGAFVFGLYNKADMNLNGVVLPANSLIATLTNGNSIEMKLPEGQYYIKELGLTETAYKSAKYSNIILNTTDVLNFSIDYNMTVSNNKFVINAGEIVNDTKSHDLVVSKKTHNDNGELVGLAGVELRVYDKNNNLVRNGISDANGNLSINGLASGTYKLTEGSPLSGYIGNTVGETFTINANGTVTGTTYLVNDKTSVTLTKKSSDGTLLANAIFRIYSDNRLQNMVMDTQYTDANGRVNIKGLPVGQYWYTELTAPAGYVKSNDTYSFTIRENGAVTGTTTVVNTPIQNRFVVALDKVDENNAPLEGAEVVLYKKNLITNRYDEVATAVSNEFGKIVFSNLLAGEYKVTETKAPAGYIRSQDGLEFTVSSTGTVTGNTKLVNKMNGVVLSKVDMVDGSPVPGATIRVASKDGTFVHEYVTDRKGEISIPGLSAGEYVFTETIAPEGYVLNREECEFTVGIDGVVTGKTQLKNAPIKFVIHKVDAATLAPVVGANIVVYDNGGNVYHDGRSDVNGEIVLEKLPVGTYTFKEVSAPSGYKLNTSVFTFVVHEDGTVTGDDTITNERSQVMVTKVNEIDTPLMGVVFDLVDNGTVLGTYVTDSLGHVGFSGLTVGKEYTLIEKRTLPGYILNETPIKFTVTNEGVSMKVLNKQNVVNLYKQSASGTYLEGAKFRVYGNGYDETFTTNTNGRITIYGLPEGTYKLKETRAPSGYELNYNEYEFTVDKYGNVSGTTTIVNDPIKEKPVPTEVTLIKVDENNKPLEGVKFNLVDNGTVVGAYETNSQGKINIKGLTVGKKYSFVETETLPGYILNETPVEFTVTNEGTIVKVVNKLNVVNLYKQSDTGEFLANAEFRVYKNGYDKTFTTNINGQITIYGLPAGTYKLKEAKAPNGYELNNSEYEFTVDEYGDITGITIIVDVPVESIPTPTRRPSTPSSSGTDVTITKVNESGEPLKGVVFDFYKNGRKLYSKETNTKGEIKLYDLSSGTYEYKEVSTLDGYILSKGTYEFTVRNGKVSGDLKVVNYRESKTVITKTDMMGKPLAGAKINIIDSNGNIVRTVVTSNDGTVTVEGLAVGTYTIQEVEAPNGYALNDNRYQFSIDSNNRISGTTIIRDDVVKINVYKTDDNGEPLKGAKFGLFMNGSDTPVMTEESDINGKLTFSGVGVGTYVIKEMLAPVGYNISTREEVVTVTNKWMNSDNSAFAFVNTLIVVIPPDPPQSDPEPEPTPDIETLETPTKVPTGPAPQDTPKTGDEISVRKLIGIAGVAVFGALFMAMQFKKKDDDDNDKTEG